MRQIRKLLLLVIMLAGLLTPLGAWAFQGLLPGAGMFETDIPTVYGQRSMRVFFYKPLAAGPDTQVVFVLHGLNRNAGDYRDQWINVAEANNLIIVAPEFTKTLYPGADGYNLGNVFDKNGRSNPRDTWSFAMIGKVFAKFQEISGTVCTRFNIFGHSAGAQFVHRMIELYPQHNIGTAISANAGWYTLPLESETWPYGLRNGPPINLAESLKDVFAQHLVVLLGEEDTDPNHKYLRNTREARAQGPHRLARGIHYFQVGQREAKRVGAAFNWELQTVPGVGHSNSRMAKTAARILGANPVCR